MSKDEKSRMDVPKWETVESGSGGTLDGYDHTWATHRLPVPGGWLYRFNLLFSNPVKKETLGDLEVTTGRHDRESMVFVPDPTVAHNRAVKIERDLR